MAGLAALTSPTALHPALSHPPVPASGVADSEAPSDNNIQDNAPLLPQECPPPQDSMTTPASLINSTCSTSDLVAPGSAPLPSQSTNQDGSHPGSHTVGLAAPDSRQSTTSQQSRGHRRAASSVDVVPRQTLMKALASVARKNKPESLSLPAMLSAHSTAEERPSSSSSQRLSSALAEIAAQRNLATPITALPALQSPCFYHNRFDDAVNIEKVLEEIQNDDFMSHSRLVQTATGVREVSKQLQRRPIRRAVRNVMIVTKARDNELVYLTKELALWLLRTPRYGSDIGVNVYVDAKLRNSKRFGASSIVDEDTRFESMLRYWSPDLCWTHPEKFDLVLTLGGDGTVLFTSWLFQRIVPPVLSFSLGSLGFLTSFEFEKYKQHLNRIMGDEGMRVNLRMRFTCTVFRDGEEGEQFEVLNELLIDRGPSPYVSNLELYGDNELLTVVQADGCIFSTPTGKLTSPGNRICRS